MIVSFIVRFDDIDKTKVEMDDLERGIENALCDAFDEYHAESRPEGCESVSANDITVFRIN